MVAINRREKDIIAERLPDARIIRTVKGRSRRQNYFCEGSGKVLKLLDELRGNSIYEKAGSRYRDTKKR